MKNFKKIYLDTILYLIWRNAILKYDLKEILFLYGSCNISKSIANEIYENNKTIKNLKKHLKNI